MSTSTTIGVFIGCIEFLLTLSLLFSFSSCRRWIGRRRGCRDSRFRCQHVDGGNGRSDVRHRCHLGVAARCAHCPPGAAVALQPQRL